MKHLKLPALFLAVLAIAASSSCSTTKGFGQDLQKVGSRLEARADETGGTAPAY
jgi:predicted small secreted protein